MYRARNLVYATIATIITFLILGFCGALNFFTGIIAVVFWYGPTLFSNKFNKW